MARETILSKRLWGPIPRHNLSYQQGPYPDDSSVKKRCCHSTASRLLSEVKHRRAWLVLRWGTTVGDHVGSSGDLVFCFLFSCFHETYRVRDVRHETEW
jgi:hypothetical protein